MSIQKAIGAVKDQTSIGIAKVANNGSRRGGGGSGRGGGGFIALNLPLNILINNAGIMFCPYQLSPDGIELQFATNNLGHFLLTNLLLDKMKHTAETSGIQGKIVNLSSIAHQHTYPAGIRFDEINEKSSYNDKKAYGQSKLANILHANELSRRLKARDENLGNNLWDFSNKLISSVQTS